MGTKPIVYCLVCGRYPTDKAHVRTKGATGCNESWNIMPLCRQCHGKQHNQGIITFILKNPPVKNYLERLGWEIIEASGMKHLHHPNFEEAI